MITDFAQLNNKEHVFQPLPLRSFQDTNALIHMYARLHCCLYTWIGVASTDRTMNDDDGVQTGALEAKYVVTKKVNFIYFK